MRQADEDILQDCLLEIQNQTTINELARIDCYIERISAAGGIKMICSAMADHIGNVQIQQYGCGSLSNMVKNHDNNLMGIVTAGSINAIVAAMNI